jgi:ClpP class serine protease
VIRHPLIAARYFNRPLALLPVHAALILEMLRGDTPAALLTGTPEMGEEGYRPFDLVSGIAVIPVRGVLVQGDACGWWGEAGYDRIGSAFRAALADEEVRAIALHIDSPGGEVSGCDRLAEQIFAARGPKPIWAILDEAGYSAAYWLAAAADHVTVPRTGGTGSVGVVGMHLDITKALDQIGFKVTTIQFGERKTDSYPTTPLSEPALAKFQADVDAIGEMFVDAVARYRGIAASAVRDQEADTFLGAAGVAAGLADAVMAPDAAFTALLDQLESPKELSV